MHKIYYGINKSILSFVVVIKSLSLKMCCTFQADHPSDPGRGDSRPDSPSVTLPHTHFVVTSSNYPSSCGLPLPPSSWLKPGRVQQPRGGALFDFPLCPEDGPDAAETRQQNWCTDWGDVHSGHKEELNKGSGLPRATAPPFCWRFCSVLPMMMPPMVAGFLFLFSVHLGTDTQDGHTSSTDSVPCARQSWSSHFSTRSTAFPESQHTVPMQFSTRPVS